MNLLARKMLPKKWSQVYTERAEEIKQKWAAQDARDEKERIATLRIRREKNEAKRRLEAELEAQIRKSGGDDDDDDEDNDDDEVFQSPVKLKDWSQHWGNSLLCYLCEKPALTEITRCKKCNIVSHILCLQYQAAQTPGAQLENLCRHCEETCAADQRFYEQQVERLKYERLLELSAAMVTRRAHVYLAVRRLERTKRSIMRIQAVCRAIIARLRHKTRMRAHLRVVLLNILQLPVLPEHIVKSGLLIVTIMDTFKGIQLFRFDLSLETIMTETVLAPGLASYMTMVFTLCAKEEVYTYSMLAQAQICIRDIMNSAQKKELTLNLVEHIQWPPQDCESVARTLTFVPNGDASLVPALQAASGSGDFLLRMHYQPQNPVLYFCMWASGPPLDLLRRSQQALSLKKKPEALSGTGTYRNSRYWLVATHNVLWFYQYYGDSAPRFGVAIHESGATMVKEKRHSTTLANLNLVDGRSWLLDFNSKGDAQRFEVAINENRKAHQSRSIYIKTAEATLPVPNLGFTVPFFN